MTWGRPTVAPAWKPDRCQDCGARFPSFNRDGGAKGTPWRCGGCDAKALPLPKDDHTPPPADDLQGALL